MEKVNFVKTMYPSEAKLFVENNKDVKIGLPLIQKLKEFITNHPKELLEVKTSVGSYPLNVDSIELLTEKKFIEDF